MGVDPEIAAFFVDRKVPADNAYWKGRLLYVARGTGYLFIPLFFDLQFKSGLPKTTILDGTYVSRMESILDLAAKYEFGQMEFREHISRIAEMVQPHLQNAALFNELNEYFGQPELQPLGRVGTDNPALNRGDALLYLLTTIPMPERVLEGILRSWYMLVPSFLLMDDLMDLKEDRIKGEENALSHYGYDPAGVREAIRTVERNFEGLASISPKLGGFFQTALDNKKRTPYFQTILNG